MCTLLHELAYLPQHLFWVTTELYQVKATAHALCTTLSRIASHCHSKDVHFPKTVYALDWLLFQWITSTRYCSELLLKSERLFCAHPRNSQFAHTEHPVNTLIVYKYGSVVIYNPIIWCYPEESCLLISALTQSSVKLPCDNVQC